MLIFSEVQKWENDDSVRQILVFPNREVKANFDKLYAAKDRIKTVSGFADENGIGAIYKLRAVKNSSSGWNGVIRCGFTGALLEESPSVSNWQDALRAASLNLRYILNSDLTEKSLELEGVTEL